MGLLLVTLAVLCWFTRITILRDYRNRDPRLLKVFIAILVYVVGSNACQCVSHTVVPLAVWMAYTHSYAFIPSTGETAIVTTLRKFIILGTWS
jgi:hypothetical protein